MGDNKLLDELLTDIATQLKRIADELEAQGRKNIVTNEDFTHSINQYSTRNSSLTPDTLINKLHEVSEFGSARFLGVCERAGIKTLGALANLTAKEFWVNKHCGWKTVDEARTILADVGLRFKGDDLSA